MQVCMGAMLKCSFGLLPSALMVTPEKAVVTLTPVANIMDHMPMKNIPSFGMCTTQANPAVAAATASATTAAGGVYTPTPAPCLPLTTSPWAPGSPTVLIAGQQSLNDISTLQCTYGGVISVVSPGQATVEIP